MKKVWTTLVLTAVLVAVVSVVAVAQEASPPDDSKGDSAARAGAREGGVNFLFLHGDGVGMRRDGTKLEVRTQKGIIEAVNGQSITLKSPDGFKQTYSIDAETKVREKRQPSSPADLKVGEMARVAAVKEGDGYTAKLINCTGEPGRRLKELLSKT